MDIETIHESLLNGQRKQIKNQINEYEGENVNNDFWAEYKSWLEDLYFPNTMRTAFEFFTDACISYHRIG